MPSRRSIRTHAWSVGVPATAAVGCRASTSVRLDGWPVSGSDASTPVTSSLTLVDALHPTAAVAVGTQPSHRGGVAAAVHALQALDQNACLVGRCPGDGEWALALRSAEVDAADPRRLRLFAGCGIVAASDPAAELAESEAKLEPMRHALAG